MHPELHMMVAHRERERQIRSLLREREDLRALGTRAAPVIWLSRWIARGIDLLSRQRGHSEAQPKNLGRLSANAPLSRAASVHSA